MTPEEAAAGAENFIRLTLDMRDGLRLLELHDAGSNWGRWRVDRDLRHLALERVEAKVRYKIDYVARADRDEVIDALERQGIRHLIDDEDLVALFEALEDVFGSHETAA